MTSPERNFWRERQHAEDITPRDRLDYQDNMARVGGESFFHTAVVLVLAAVVLICVSLFVGG